MRIQAHSIVCMRKIPAGVAILVNLLMLGCSDMKSPAQPLPPGYEPVFELSANEGVFAYSRISPDGRFLAYASEPRRGGGSRVINVVDLNDRRVVFSESGIDAYWSNDGTRMIYLSFSGNRSRVSIRHHATGAITRDVAPDSLGDYYSWGIRDGRDLILTIRSRYYFLNGDQAELPAGVVPPCAGIGTGERPLLSKDGRRATTFVGNVLVIRSVTDCSFILNTGVPAAKADFSFDGRYVAFHAPKPDNSGFEIQVIDIERRTIRTVTNLPGSSFFPSWTQDGRLSFRYDSNGFRGFLFVDSILDLPEEPLPTSTVTSGPAPRWEQVFPNTPRPATPLTLVLVWGPWSAHAPDALAHAQRAREMFAAENLPVELLTATDPGSREEDVAALIARHNVKLPRITLAKEQFVATGAHNQNPTVLLFEGDALIDRRLGAQTTAELLTWVRQRGVIE